MKNIHNILMLFGAMALATACTNSEEEPNYGEITLTTPVVTLDGVKATVSRAESTSPNYSDMELHVDLLKASSTDVSRYAMYKYENSEWSIPEDNGNKALVVTGGTGDYHARAWAKVDLEETADIPAITGAIYATENPSQMKVEDGGKFTFDGEYALEPQTAAIQVTAKSIGGMDIAGYTVALSDKLSQMAEFSWELSTTENSETDECMGNYSPAEFSVGEEIMIISYNGKDYTVKAGSDGLNVEAGKYYHFIIKLTGVGEIIITPPAEGDGDGDESGTNQGGVIITGFGADGGTINIGRK